LKIEGINRVDIYTTRGKTEIEREREREREKQKERGLLREFRKSCVPVL